jgi:hypothetical protein
MAENEGLRSKFCQEISWWMKSAAIFATAGFTSVHTWAEKCNIYEAQMKQTLGSTLPTL